GGGLRRINLDNMDALAAAPPDDLLAFDEALERLTRHDPTAAQLVRLHGFAGLTVEQAAEALDLSRATAYRLWTFARAWLHCQLAGSVPGPAAPEPDQTGGYQTPAVAPGTVIGPYKLIEQIGEGGMGAVWMAQQTEPVKRLVAVKLIKAGMDSKQVIARFEAERQS